MNYFHLLITLLVRNFNQEWKKLSVDQIHKIWAAAPERLKAIAEKEGHHVEWLLIFLIPMNIGNNYCYQWILIKYTIFCLQPLLWGSILFFPPCNAKFTRKGSLNKHIATVHEGLKPHKCPFCNHSASLKSNLTVHLESVHEGLKPHKCPFCSHCSSKKYHVTKHIKSIHDETK